MALVSVASRHGWGSTSTGRLCSAAKAVGSARDVAAVPRAPATSAVYTPYGWHDGWVVSNSCILTIVLVWIFEGPKFCRFAPGGRVRAFAPKSEKFCAFLFRRAQHFSLALRAHTQSDPTHVGLCDTTVNTRSYSCTVVLAHRHTHSTQRPVQRDT